MNTYRYTLQRVVAHTVPQRPRILLWVMLNPSTADDTYDDATIRRLKSFTLGFNFDAFMVGNLYAFRATNPKELLKADDPVGPQNDSALTAMMLCADAIICAWGQPGPMPERYLQLLEMIGGRTLLCLGVNANGHPKHPLRLSRNTQLRTYPCAPVKS